jgi:ribonuclease P protein component
MLPKHLRLQSNMIPTIARRGKLFSNEYFDLRVWWDDKLDYPKFAISISIKIDKRAVVRNRIKRKLRSVIQELVKENRFKKGSYLIIVRSVKLKDVENSSIKALFVKVL